MAIKGFFKKYILVNKCSSIAEAKQQKKDRLKILILSGIFGVAYIVFDQISSSPSDFFGTLSGIMMIPATLCLVAGLWFSYKADAEVRRLNAVLCKSCGEKFTLDKTQYHLLSERRSSGSPDNQGFINFTVVHTYKFDCTCGKCGKKSSFNSDFIYSQGTIKDRIIRSERVRDVEKDIQEFFA